MDPPGHYLLKMPTFLKQNWHYQVLPRCMSMLKPSLVAQNGKWMSPWLILFNLGGSFASCRAWTPPIRSLRDNILAPYRSISMPALQKPFILLPLVIEVCPHLDLPPNPDLLMAQIPGTEASGRTRSRHVNHTPSAVRL